MAKYIVVIIMFFWVKVYSQKNPGILIPYLEGEKYGFSDDQGNLIIGAKYDIAYPFFSGHEITMVVNNTKAAIINRKGRKIRNASSDYMVESDKISFEQAYKFIPEGIALDIDCLSDSCPEFEIINSLGSNHLIDKMSNLYFVKEANKVILINSKGKTKSKEFDRIKHFISPEIEYAITEDINLKKFGLLDAKGEQLLECVYDEVIYNGKGIFELRQAGKTYPYKVNYNDKYVPKVLDTREVNKNRIISRREGKFGVSDSLKNVVLPYRFKKIYPLGDDNYLFWTSDSVGIVRAGSGIIVGNLVKASVNGIIGTSEFVPYIPYTQKLAFLNDGIHWHLVSTEGEMLIDDIEGIFVDFQKVANNISGIVLNGKIGVIDNTGKTIIDFKYDEISCLAGNNTFVVKEGNKWNWINSDGRIILYDFEDFKYLINGYLFVKKNGGWFYVNDKGRVFRK